MTIRLITFGGFSALHDGAAVDDLAAQRLRAALLVHLSVERRAPRDALAALLWPESDAANARQSVRQTLYQLKRAFGDDWVEQNNLELRATPDLWSDAFAFEMALHREDFETAAKLYAGPFLAGVHLLNVRPWEDWVEQRRRQLSKAYRRACREWVNERAAAADDLGAIAAARRWLAPDPIDDEAQDRLIRLLAEAGQRTEALRQYDAYVRLLEPEGLTPLDETRAFVEAVRFASSAPPATDVPVIDDEPASHPRPPPHTDADRTGLDRVPVDPEPGPPPGPAPHPGPHRLWKRLAIAAVTAVALGSVLSRLWRDVPNQPPAGGTGLDTLAYVVYPISGDSTGVLTPLLEEALGRWDPIEVIAPIVVQERLRQRPDGELTSVAARQLADNLRAGRYVLARVIPLRDSIGVHAQLFDTARNLSLADSTAWVPRDLTGIRDAMNALADALLVGRGRITRMVGERPSTIVFPARLAYAAASAAILDWRLGRADSALGEAIRYDASFAQAYLWRALVRAWAGEDAATWLGFATQAWTLSGDLGERESGLARATLAWGRATPETLTCVLWDSLTTKYPTDFAAWYGSGACRQRDAVVLPDPTSPSQWRFRSSHHAAVRAYRQAYLLLPSIHRALRGNAFDAVRGVLRLDPADFKTGIMLAGDRRFYAMPMWQDSLVFFPIPDDSIMSPPAWLSPDIVDEAVRNQAAVFREIATAWVAAYPRSPDALEALAISLEMDGDPAALDTLRSARRLAADPIDALRLATSEVWLRVKLALGPGGAGLAEAAQLADSILASPEIDRLPLDLTAGLAALRGRASRAAVYQRRAGERDALTPAPLRAPANALLAFASLGGPADSLRVYRRQVEVAIRDFVQEEEKRDMKEQWLARAYTLAFPSMDPVRDGAQDPLLAAQLAALDGDVATARGLLGNLLDLRSGYSPAYVAMDAVLAEALTFDHLGDTRAAYERIVPVLDKVPASTPYKYVDVTRAASLVRAMALRARLADRLGDRETARVWAARVATLWAGADAFLRPELTEMRRLAAR